MAERCKVCSAGMSELVDAELDKATMLDHIQQKLARLDPAVSIHRSSIHRHKHRCYLPKLRLRLADKKAHGSAQRLVVQWPDDLPLFGSLAGKYTDGDTGDPIAPSQVRQNDIVLVVGFEQIPRKQDAPKEETTTITPLQDAP